jgi:NAD+ kinase
VTFERIAFVASGTAEAEAVRLELASAYGSFSPEEADVVVALGGDGLMLQCLHSVMGRNVPVFGMNFGSVGFLMNNFARTDLNARLEAAQATEIYPLEMQVVDAEGRSRTALALNEVSLFRTTYQAAKLQILVDGETRLDELICDGILLSTPGRLHRLQPLRARADPAHRLAAPRAHADLALPPPAAGAALSSTTTPPWLSTCASATSARSAP